MELNVLMEQEYSLMVAEFVDAFTNLSIQYGDTCDTLVFEKQAFTEPKDFTNCMALYNIQLSDCFVATLSADNGSFAIHIRGHFHGKEMHVFRCPHPFNKYICLVVYVIIVSHDKFY